MRPVAPILTAELFPLIRVELLSLLNGLSEEEWGKPTAAGTWDVKDVALHILGGDIGNLSRRRDGYSLAADLSSYEKLVAFINEINALWVAAGQRMSPRMIVDLLEHVGRQADEYFAGLDQFAMGGPVSWAGDAPMPVWFDVAREYTERWHHQQQIRDATGRPGLYERRFSEPVLDTFVRGLPHTFRPVEAADGTSLRLVVTGVVEKEWTLVRSEGTWVLFDVDSTQGARRTTRAQGHETVVTIAAERAWKIFTRGIRGPEAAACANVVGDRALGERVLGMVSVLA